MLFFLLKYTYHKLTFALINSSLHCYVYCRYCFIISMTIAIFIMRVMCNFAVSGMINGAFLICFLIWNTI